MEETEINEPLIPAEPTGLLLLEDAQYYLHEAGRWARFLGIMGFIGAGFILLFAVFFGSKFSMFPNFHHYGPPRYPMTRPYPMSPAPIRPFPMFFSGFIGLIYGGTAILYFFVSLNLYRFGTGIKQAIVNKNSVQVSAALKKLNTFFKMKGIIVICILALYVLILIGVVIAFSIMRS